MHKKTRPYRPQTNGKVERFNGTLHEEWAFASPYASETERVAAFPAFLHNCNHHRDRTALKGASPADRLPNLAGQCTSATTLLGCSPVPASGDAAQLVNGGRAGKIASHGESPKRNDNLSEVRRQSRCSDAHPAGGGRQQGCCGTCESALTPGDGPPVDATPQGPARVLGR